MDLLNSKEALDFLCKSAPRPWVKRMLLWMIFNREVVAYFQTGRIVPRAMVWSVVSEKLDGVVPDQERDELISKHFDADLARKLIERHGSEYIEDEATEWGPGNPEPVAAGYFVHASHIDWDTGSLEAELHNDDVVDDILFWGEDDHLGSNFARADYLVFLTGLCFERDDIEMLQPNVELAVEMRGHADGVVRLGRPRSWDWEGATTYLLTLAQHPDGLPTGAGAQAKIERSIAEWFMQKAGNAPAPSQVRQHAAKIMRALKKPESR